MSEEFFIYAKPNITGIKPDTLYLNNSAFFIDQNIEFLVQGEDLKRLTGLYLSASNINMFDDLYYINTFSNIEKLSADNPSFSGVIISIFIYKENYIAFKLPQIPKTVGFFDVIVENEAGYGKLTTGSIVPFVSSWRGATDTQKPSTSGVRIAIN
jgi:hypothetical protein